jgi:predicted  nucleic acid-binding Zn-ribbon protein
MRKITLFVAALSLMACDKSKPELDKALAQVTAISAEKDSLLKDVMQTSQFIAEVNSEMAKVKSRTPGKPTVGKPGEMESNLTPAQQRDAIKVKIKELTDRLNESESRLSASRNRVKDLTSANAGMSKQLAAFDSTIAAFKTIMDNQKAEIASLTEQLNALQAENTSLKADKASLTAEKTQLTEQKGALTTERNTVYYIIGNKDELLAKKLVEQVGGFIGIGKSQVPARNLNASDFTTIDKTKVMEIAFPKTDKSYRIITRQDVTALETAPDGRGRIKGGIKIKDVDKFWAASKFLILLEQ